MIGESHHLCIYNSYLLHVEVGQTAFERLGGITCKRTIWEFVEMLLYRPMRDDIPKAEASWNYRTFLGKCTQHDQHCIGMFEGASRTTDAKRLPKSERNYVVYLRISSGLVGSPAVRRRTIHSSCCRTLRLRFLPFPKHDGQGTAGRTLTTKAHLRATGPLQVKPADNNDAWRTARTDHVLHDEELLRRFHRRLRFRTTASTTRLHLRINTWQH